MLKKALFSVLLLAVVATTALAQGVDEPIAYDQLVEGDISDDEFFDWWHLEASAGDIIVVTMIGMDGLAPLIGLLDPSRNLVARSDQVAPETLIPAPPNGRTQLQFTAETSGDHIINATRDGNFDGTTTGTYTLTVRRGNEDDVRENDLQPVEFRCDGTLVTTITTLQFTQDVQQDLRIRVYSLDDFEPLIRINFGDELGDIDDCFVESDGMGDDQLILPDMDIITYEEDAPETVAGFGLIAGNFTRRVTLTIGSANGVAGRWVVVIEGLSIAPEGDVDSMDARIGPLAAADTDMLVYMVTVGATRLNPQIGVIDPDGDGNYLESCNDIGRRGCPESVPDFDGYGVILADGTEIIGDQFTAGLRLSPGDVSIQELQFGSFAPSATGSYALIMIGELPARESAQDD